MSSLLIHGLVGLGLWSLTPPDTERSPSRIIRFQFVDDRRDNAQALQELQPAFIWRRPRYGGPHAEAAADRHRRSAPDRSQPTVDNVRMMLPLLATQNLQDAHLNNLARNQAQRTRNSVRVSTLELRRALPDPAHEVRDSRGSAGPRAQHRPGQAPGAPGVEQSDGSALDGNAPGLSTHAEGAAVLPTVKGQSGRNPGRNARSHARAQGKRPRRRSKLGRARPAVDRGPAAVNTLEREAPVRDNRDAELLAADLQRSLVEASVRRSYERRPGPGGLGGRGPGGRSGQDFLPGARTLPYRPGPDPAGALDRNDRRYVRWFEEQRARVARSLVFPAQSEIALHQGTCVYRLVVRRDGSFAGAPALLRSSGHADMDAAADRALRDSAPFTPLPETLAPSLREIALVIPVEFRNPVVQ